MRRKTPQEKKRLSLQKDRRNLYGENSKTSRKAVAKRKRIQNREDRRAPSGTLRGLAGLRDARIEQELEVSAARKRRPWRKVADTPLLDVIEKKFARRVEMGIVNAGKAKSVRQKLRRRLGKRDGLE